MSARLPVIDDLRMIDKKELQKLLPIAPVTVWRLERAGKFPRRRAITANRVGWRLREIQEWIESRPAAALAPTAPRAPK